MLYKKSLYADVPVLIDIPRMYVAGVDFVTRRVAALQSCCAHLNVLLKSLKNVRCHFLCALRPIQAQGLCPFGNPGSEDQVWQSERVVAVKMGQERDIQFNRPESGNPALESRIGLPDHARSCIHQIGLPIHNDSQ